ncbi:hypothetical protein VSF3289_03608 [Vibrio scophthalmi]|uniref:Uncharacterized protein n=1 Tax=Vibrio scophthalmi TaxID=45658 RepID=A0A1E3WF67_9VIBR|nr:hypothetical protein VSF3289_03608 [Vibrio scophthalmi]
MTYNVVALQGVYGQLTYDRKTDINDYFHV